MAQRKKLVIVNSRGPDDERSSVAWSIANTAAASEMDVTMFLVAAGADWARKGAADAARPNRSSTKPSPNRSSVEKVPSIQ